MTGALQDFLRQQPLRDARRSVPPPPDTFGGRLVAARAIGDHVVGRPSYVLISRRGGFDLGTVSFSNQWQAYSWRGLPGDTPVNQEIVAEIYAVLRDLNRRAR